MHKQKITAVAPAAYVWLAMVMFGGVLVETIVIYPNVFHDAPASLTEATEFFSETGPADLFPPLGALTAVAGVLALVLSWPYRRARVWIGASLAALLLGDFLFSMLYFWPRNDIMFEDGAAVHSAGFLRQTAREFEAGHWVRLAMSGLTATLAFHGYLMFHRSDVGNRPAARPERTASER